MGMANLSLVVNTIEVSFVAPSFQAFIAEQSTEETRGRVYGMTEAMFTIVGVVGPLIGGYLAQGLSFKVMWIVAAAFYGTAAVIRVMMAQAAKRKEEVAGEHREKPSLQNLKNSLAAMGTLLAAGGVVTWIFVSDGVQDVAFGMTQQLMPLYLENLMGLSLIQIGWLNSLSAGVGMIFMGPAGWLSDKKGERIGLVGGFAIICLGWAFFLFGRTFVQFVVAWAIIGVGHALIVPAYNSLISKAVPLHLRGTAFGLFSTSLGLISLPAPWIGAQLWEAFRPIVPFYIPLAAMLLLLPMMWIKFRLPDAPAEDTVDLPVPAQ